MFGLSSGCLGMVLRMGVYFVDLSTLVADSRLALVVYGYTITPPLILMASVWGSHLADDGNNTLRNFSHRYQTF